MTILMGVDGCTGGWIAAIDEGIGRPPSCERLSSIADVMARQPATVAIDVPIGLAEAGARDCDLQARSLLGPRRGSVFTAPIRAVLTATSHGEACAARFAVEGKKMSLQAWGIVTKVAEVDAALRGNEFWQACVREVHPELCFRELNGAPLAHSKKQSAGKAERLELLRPVFGDAVERALTERPRLKCAADDIIDAFVALWTARRIACGMAVPYPLAPPRDSYRIAMQMWV